MKLLMLVLVLTATAVQAQDFPKVEIFGGYAGLITPEEEDQGFVIPRQAFHGWGAAITGNLAPWFGLAFHAGGNYGSIDVDVPVGNAFVPVSTDIRVHGFFFGPEFSARAGSVRVFVHPMLGATRVSASADAGVGLPNVSDSEGNFAWMAGGGIDIGSGRTAARVIQFDAIRIHADNAQTNYRIAAGLVVRF